MYILCSDLEGVWVPEVWINVAKKTGIEELKLTTRDITDYDVLMNHRLKILAEHKLTIRDIQDVIATIQPIEGAKETLDYLRKKVQIIIVSDTFEQFADPLMDKLGRPALLCHTLSIDDKGMIIGYNLRQKDPKRQVVKALQSLQYKVISFGDSYNDISMLQQSEAGILYHPPQNVINDYPEFPVVKSYEDLLAELRKYVDL